MRIGHWVPSRSDWVAAPGRDWPQRELPKHDYFTRRHEGTKKLCAPQAISPSCAASVHFGRLEGGSAAHASPSCLRAFVSSCETSCFFRNRHTPPPAGDHGITPTGQTRTGDDRCVGARTGRAWLRDLSCERRTGNRTKPSVRPCGIGRRRPLRQAQEARVLAVRPWGHTPD